MQISIKKRENEKLFSLFYKKAKVQDSAFSNAEFGLNNKSLVSQVNLDSNILIIHFWDEAGLTSLSQIHEISSISAL
jgi:hypothetical protein